MNFRSFSRAALLTACVLAPALAAAQSTTPPGRSARATIPSLPTRAAPPSRPADVGDAVPPGFGGNNGRGTRGDGHGNANGAAHGQLPRVPPRPCAPGGALSPTPEHGQVGRERARARVCGGG